MKLWKTLLGTAFLLCLLMTLAAIPVFGAEIVETGPCGDNLTYTLDADGILTISGTGPMWDYKCAMYYDEERRTDIIYSLAPWGTSDYSVLRIEPGVTTIGNNAFYAKNDEFTGNSFSILTNVSLPEGLVSIGEHAFQFCASLTSISFPKTLTSIGDDAFGNCRKLRDFYLTDIPWWLSLSVEGDSLCADIHRYEYAASSRRNIRLYFNGELLTDLIIPEGITSIRNDAFFSCSSLRSVTFPEGFTSIGPSAFENCPDLTSVYFPKSLTSIGSCAFTSCNKLTDFYLTDIVSWLSLSVDGFSLYAIDLEFNYYFYYKKDCRYYLQGELITDLVIPDEITNIRNYAFYGFSSLSSVSIPEGLSSIGDSAFYNCSGLTTLSFPKEMTSIGDYSFYGCSDLSNAVFPETLTTIGEYAFYDNALTNVTFPDKLTEIGEYAFSHCNDLLSATFLGGLTNIGDQAFYQCENLSGITIAKGLLTIGNKAFADCPNLTKFYLSDIMAWFSMPDDFSFPNQDSSVNRIFVDGKPLTDLVVPEGVTHIRNDAFYNYSDLNSVILPEGLQIIGDNAFYGCANLTSITFPQELTSIANDSFKNCSGLTNLIFLGEPPSIGSTAFASLTLTVYHPEDASWTDSTKLNYGGTLTYKPLGSPTGLQMSLSDTYPYYFTDDVLSKEKMTTTLTYSSGAVSRLHPTQYELKADDITTPGAKTVTISTEGLSTSYAVFVHNGHRIENIPQTWPESSHDHPNNADDIQTLYIPGANLIQITFDQRTALEPWYDFLYVYDANDTQIAQFTGTKAAGLTLAVPGDTVKLRLTSDAATANWGYAITDVSASWMEHEFNSDSGTCSICDNYCAHTYAEGAVITAPWCEISGEQAYTCTQCGYCKTETIPALGHSYENGMCSNCGAIDFDNVTDPGLKLGYPTLSFEDEIVYNIYFYVTDPTNVAELGLMTLSGADRYATIEDATATIPGYVTNGTMYLVKTNGIPAAHMGDTLYFKVYAKLTDGSYAYSVLGGYNAKTYADTMLDGDYPDAMKSLVVSMLNYGAEAQRYFGHNTDALVDSTLTDAQKAMIRAFDSTMVDAIAKLDPSKIKGFTRNDGDFRTLYPSVSFDGAFAINLYCGPTVTVDDVMTLYWWDAETADTADRLTLDNATGSAPMDLVLTDWWGQLPGIAAKDISKTYYLTCVFTSDGETITTGIIPYSLGKYCAGKADAEGDPQQALSQATAVYGYYAKNYFASIT